MASEEIWKDVLEYEDVFQVSTRGRIFSKRTNRILQASTLKTGYLGVSSRIGGRKGKTICLKVHRVVAVAFVLNPNNLPCVNHIDGVKGNNSVDNLEWVTHSENVRHARDTGLCYYPNVFDDGASSSKREKLTKEEVEYIRSVYKPHDKEFGARPLARKYGVDHSCIHRLASRKNYITREERQQQYLLEGA